MELHQGFELFLRSFSRCNNISANLSISGKEKCGLFFSKEARVDRPGHRVSPTICQSWVYAETGEKCKEGTHLLTVFTLFNSAFFLKSTANVNLAHLTPTKEAHFFHSFRTYLQAQSGDGQRAITALYKRKGTII